MPRFWSFYLEGDIFIDILVDRRRRAGRGSTGGRSVMIGRWAGGTADVGNGADVSGFRPALRGDTGTQE